MEKTKFTLKVVALLLMVPAIFIGSILHGSHNASLPQDQPAYQQGTSQNSGLAVENAQVIRNI